MGEKRLKLSNTIVDIILTGASERQKQNKCYRMLLGTLTLSHKRKKPTNDQYNIDGSSSLVSRASVQTAPSVNTIIKVHNSQQTIWICGGALLSLSLSLSMDVHGAALQTSVLMCTL